MAASGLKSPLGTINQDRAINTDSRISQYIDRCLLPRLDHSSMRFKVKVSPNIFEGKYLLQYPKWSVSFSFRTVITTYNNIYSSVISDITKNCISL